MNATLTDRIVNEALFIVDTLDREAAEPLLHDLFAPLVQCYVALGGVYNLTQGGALKAVYPIVDDIKARLDDVREVVENIVGGR